MAGGGGKARDRPGDGPAVRDNQEGFAEAKRALAEFRATVDELRRTRGTYAAEAFLRTRAPVPAPAAVFRGERAPCGTLIPGTATPTGTGGGSG